MEFTNEQRKTIENKIPPTRCSCCRGYFQFQSEPYFMYKDDMSRTYFLLAKCTNCGEIKMYDVDTLLGNGWHDTK